MPREANVVCTLRTRTVQPFMDSSKGRRVTTAVQCPILSGMGRARTQRLFVMLELYTTGGKTLENPTCVEGCARERSNS